MLTALLRFGAATAALSLCLGLSACGGDAARDSLGRAVSACEAEGGVWRIGGCEGLFDTCGVRTCNNVLGDGCACDAPPEHCWDAAERRCRALRRGE